MSDVPLIGIGIYTIPEAAPWASTMSFPSRRFATRLPLRSGGRVKVLIDNDLSPHIASAMNAPGEPREHHVFALRKKFPPHAVDEVWIRALGEEGG